MGTNMKLWGVLLILTLTICLSGCLPHASANPTGAAPQLAMPLEHVNYTLTNLNGSAWATVDGEYPISLQTTQDCSFSGDLPMVYPMPPGTTDIHIYLDDAEVEWSNYTAVYPDALHQTALGDWWMIYAPLTVSDNFTLKIHYEHPLQVVNGSTLLFLYDLNISTYLSPDNPESTAVFTVRTEGNFSGLKVYTAPPSSIPSQWMP